MVFCLSSWIGVSDCSLGLAHRIGLLDWRPRLASDIGLPHCSPRLHSQIAFRDCSGDYPLGWYRDCSSALLPGLGQGIALETALWHCCWDCVEALLSGIAPSDCTPRCHSRLHLEIILGACTWRLHLGLYFGIAPLTVFQLSGLFQWYFT